MPTTAGRTECRSSPLSLLESPPPATGGALTQMGACDTILPPGHGPRQQRSPSRLDQACSRPRVAPRSVCAPAVHASAAPEGGPVRILMLNYEFPPLGAGGATSSFNLARNVVRLGHEVDVVTMSFRGVPRRELLDGV